MAIPDPDEVRKRFEAWKSAIAVPYEMAFWILLRKVRMPFDQAWDCLHTALANLLKQWEKFGPPQHVENWASYLATAAYNVYMKPPKRDARLLVFQATLPEFQGPSDGQADPCAIAANRDEFAKALSVLIQLPAPRAAVLLLWALGRSFTQIGKALNTSAGNARVLKHLGIRELREGMRYSDYELN